MKLDELLQTTIELAQSTRPQDGITAAYIFRFLLRFSSISKSLSRLCEENQLATLVIFRQSDNDVSQPYFLCCVLLLLLLRQQLNDARINLLKTAATRPLYPTMLCIRYVIADVCLR